MWGSISQRDEDEEAT
jgi:hypothetical protein